MVGEPDPTVTPSAGLVLVAELDRVLGVVGTIDGAVGPIKGRRQGHQAGGLLLALAESMLAGGDFLCDLDVARSDVAGCPLRAVAEPPASTTAIGLAKRFDAAHFSGVEAAMGSMAARAFGLLPADRQDRLRATPPTLDLDPTDVEVHGSSKQGVAFNYRGERCGRPTPVVWAEAGWILAADLVDGNTDPRALAAGLIARAVAGLPPGLARPRVRADAGLFDKNVADAALANGCDYAIAAKRTAPAWRAVTRVPAESWQPALAMTAAEITECDYQPAGWPPGTRCVVRRVRIHDNQIRSDGRSRRRRTIHPDQLSLLTKGDPAGQAYAYSFILTNLPGPPTTIEAWFRERAQIEERLKDTKLGMALRHLPSSYHAVNTVWMWAAFLGLNLSAWAQALGKIDNHGRAHGKRLRRELINIPARVLHHARRTILRLNPIHHHGPFLHAWTNLTRLPNAP